MMTREQYVEHMKKQLDEWNTKLGKWEGEVQKAQAGAKVHYEAQIKVLEKQRPAYYEATPPEVVAMSPEWRRNYDYFRKWVMPEFMKAQREDENACLTCHALAGRVPSMELVNHRDGYMPEMAAYANYKILLERINETNVEQSKLLRKPLNIQSGKEDGHQGGRRFNPEDRGYLILRQWVLDAAQLKQGRK